MCSDSTFNLQVPQWSVLEVIIEEFNPHTEEKSCRPFVTNQTGFSAAKLSKWPFFFFLFFVHVTKQKRLTALIPGTLLC